jgi:hypothetical protein
VTNKNVIHVSEINKIAQVVLKINFYRNLKILVVQLVSNIVKKVINKIMYRYIVNHA